MRDMEYYLLWKMQDLYDQPYVPETTKFLSLGSKKLKTLKRDTSGKIWLLGFDSKVHLNLNLGAE